MPRPRERVYTLDKQKKHLARLSLLSAKRFRFNVLNDNFFKTAVMKNICPFICWETLPVSS